MDIKFVFVALTITSSLMASSARAQNTGFQDSTVIDSGYHQMYNLHFNKAHTTFEHYMAQHSQDPMGPVSNAAAYLFSEFHRTGVLDVQLFTNDDSYLHHSMMPDPAVKKALDTNLDKAEQLADAILKTNPKNARALFAKTLTYGLRADYASLIERKDLKGFQFTKQGSLYAHQLLQVDPTAYDAYLAVGMENYILGLKPAPVRWLLHMAGGETDKTLGEKDLELTAAQGHYLRPLAKLLLAVAAIRDQDKKKARALLTSLAREFPNNPLYAQQLAKIG